MADQGSAGTTAVQLLLPDQQAVRQRFDQYTQLDEAATEIPSQRIGVQQPAAAS